MFFWFVAARYLKPTFVILLALESFFILVDSMQHLDLLSGSANIAVQFLAFNAMYAFNYVLPLSLLLGLIVFYITLIKSNQYIALLSLGYSKKQIFFPPFLLINLSICGYVGLNATDFAYAQESVENIISRNTSGGITSDLFIRYENDYIYFKKVYPLLQKAQGIKVYHTLNTDNGEKKLVSITRANEGFFENNEWILHAPVVATFPAEYTLGGAGLSVETFEKMNILKGFKPKILDTFYKNKPSVSLLDAIYSLQILWSENADSKRTRGIIYALGIVPFFISMLAVIIAYYAPPLARYGNLAMLGITFSVVSLLVWGVFFSLSKLNANAVFIPEISLLLPLFILFVISCRYYKRINRI
ncbi:LptF/LptG family permease [Helicobacter saguini]|uniref:LptF/LptG family permease n=1 Tax=Helicobacter saguini TaxID=1548018 RepID=A0A347VV79_9HELI|nr:LptF/LptG family permease [Helicobacter saguini]MWV62539.1 LptF/LptG family permease [Helicobacter saguini]MWV66787.1 LptF/LptG family permease [Helicobacter saguini]MWV69138.1 LptF/LptG family permease [Helicobacter saguini]MWV71307.1 LptF/LptG family permease [Helicobacter saguini]TLD94182.1 LptF/LptG family permease [Helicobacter saguini]